MMKIFQLYVKYVLLMQIFFSIKLMIKQTLLIKKFGITALTLTSDFPYVWNFLKKF